MPDTPPSGIFLAINSDPPAERFFNQARAMAGRTQAGSIGETRAQKNRRARFTDPPVRIREEGSGDPSRRCRTIRAYLLWHFRQSALPVLSTLRKAGLTLSWGSWQEAHCT